MSAATTVIKAAAKPARVICRKSTNGAHSAFAIDDFYAYLPMHQYIFVPTRELWPGASVNQVLKCDGRATDYLDKHRAVAQMTWAPGRPMIIQDQLVSDGGWISHPGSSTFNLYRPPEVKQGDPLHVEPWLAHVTRLFGNDVEHLLDWLAHRVQHPGNKINHALVLGGNQGIGKDTILEPIKFAIGPWNFTEVSPAQVLGRFNGFIKSVILRLSEARDLGDVDRYAFYEHTKVLTAAPPDVLRCDEKNLREHSVINCTGVIITTNHKSDGIYLPLDDRRHFVVWSNLSKEEFSADHFRQLYAWYEAGGAANVAAYLRARDLSNFDAKAPPPKTEAWHDIVNASRAPEDANLADVLDACRCPAAITLERLIVTANNIGQSTFAAFLGDLKNRRAIPHRLENAEYVPVRNRDADDGLWRIQGRRQVAYARRNLSECDRLNAVRKLV
jgi:Family of unknown function (DUF5906)